MPSHPSASVTRVLLVAPARTCRVAATFEGFYFEEGGFFPLLMFELSPDLSFRETEKITSLANGTF